MRLSAPKAWRQQTASLQRRARTLSPRPPAVLEGLVCCNSAARFCARCYQTDEDLLSVYWDAGRNPLRRYCSVPANVGRVNLVSVKSITLEVESTAPVHARHVIASSWNIRLRRIHGPIAPKAFDVVMAR